VKEVCEKNKDLQSVLFFSCIEKKWKKQTKDNRFSRELFMLNSVVKKKGALRDENSTYQQIL